ncbi:MAG: MBL fold metallo-hydrolase [Verrucomicrobiota bacterium]
MPDIPSFSFQSLTRATDIGANCYLLEMGDSRIILDAGTHPKREGADNLPDFNQLPYDSIDAIILSHAHLDHAGALPVLIRDQPGARVFMSEETRELTDSLLHNSVNVMTSQRDELDIPEFPLFTHGEINAIQADWETPASQKPFRCGHNDEITCEFFPAGHILGSVGVLLKCQGKSVFYTGDVHFEDQTLSKAAQFPTEGIDVLITETTRGAAPRRTDYTRQGEIDRLADAIRQTIDRGGSTLIPLFAMGKSQELLLILHQLKESGQLDSNIPVYVGGLTTKMTVTHDRFADTAHRNHRGFRFLSGGMDLIVASKKRKKKDKNRSIPYDSGRIYALSSGMMTENTVSHAFARNILPNERNSILFVGYAAEDSPGGRLLAARDEDEFQLDEDSSPIALRCQIERFDFSGHATRGELRDYARQVAAKQVILVHGDEPARQWFQETLSADLPESTITIAAPGEVIPL